MELMDQVPTNSYNPEGGLEQPQGQRSWMGSIQ
jgi:hypothetical protein